MGTHSLLSVREPDRRAVSDTEVAAAAERVSIGRKILHRMGFGVTVRDDSEPDPEVSLENVPLHMPFELLNSALGEAPPAKGWRKPWKGWAPNVTAGTVYQSTTAQMPGFYPFPAPAGAQVRGVPFGHHLHTAEPIGLDPAQWLVDGLVTNTGIWMQGQPGVGKSTGLKRIGMGLVGFGFMMIVPGDLKDEYTRMVRAMGGEVFRLGRGLDSLNPLDRGPLIAVINATIGSEKQQLAALANSRRLALMEALITIVGGQELTATNRLLLGTAVSIANDAADDDEPIIPDVLRAIDAGSDPLRDIMAVPHKNSGLGEDLAYAREVRDFRNAVALLCSDDGPIRGMFDRPSSFRVTKDLPALSLSLSAIEDEGDDVVAAAMLCASTWSASVVEAHQAGGKRRNIFQPRDEMWRALRAAPGLVEKEDRSTRLNRHRGMVTAQSTHSVTDLDALPTEEDRSKAKGMAARNGVKILGGLDNAEMTRLHEIMPFTSRERRIVTQWSAPPTWVPGQRHPGRGKYLIKSGARMGLPVRVELVPEEVDLYDTDNAWTSLEAKNHGAA